MKKSAISRDTVIIGALIALTLLILHLDKLLKKHVLNFQVVKKLIKTQNFKCLLID